MNQKGVIHILLLIVVILGLGAAGYWFLTTQQIKTKAPSTQEPTTTDKTANWETYNNNSAGFTLKYPSSFTLTDEDNLITLKREESWLRIVYSSSKDAGYGGGCDQWQEIYLAGKIRQACISNMGIGQLYVTHPTNNLEFSINAKYSPPDKETFHQILSTFKFLGENDSKRTTTVRKSDGTPTTIDLNSIKQYPESQVFDDTTNSWIEKTILSPDESKVAVVTSDGNDVYIVLLADFDKPDNLQEIGLNDYSKLDSILWSSDSRYITTVSMPANTGPYRTKVWDTQTNNQATMSNPVITLKDSCASLSIFDPKWINNTTIQAKYKAYYFYSNEDCQPSSETNKNEEGTTILHIKQ